MLYYALGSRSKNILGQPDVPFHHSLATFMLVILLPVLLFASVPEEQEAEKFLTAGKWHEAANLYKQVAEKYQKVGDKVRFKSSLAKYNFYKGIALGTSFQIGTVVSDDNRLSDALSAFKEAKKLFSDTGNKVGVMGAEGWEVLIEGLIKERETDFDKANALYTKSMKIFQKIIDEYPPTKETIENWALFAKRGIISTKVSIVLNSLESIKEKSTDMADFLLRAAAEDKNPDFQNLYKGRAFMIIAMARILEADELVDSWRIKDSGRLVEEAEKSLKNAEEYFNKLPETASKDSFMRMGFNGWKFFLDGIKSYSDAINSLLSYKIVDSEKDLREAYNFYGKARDAFGSELYSLIKMRMGRIQGMAEAVKGESNIEKITLGMGKWAFIFFLLSLGALAVLKRFTRVELSGKHIIIVALLIAIISAFGLRAGEILGKLTEILKTF